MKFLTPKFSVLSTLLLTLMAAESHAASNRPSGYTTFVPLEKPVQ